jgi:hypothetical protein
MGQAVPASTGDAIAHAARHGHKLLFPTFDGSEDPFPWLNRCDQFFRIRETSEAGKVFLATLYMFGNAMQWYALLERNHGQPSWQDFVKLVNQRFGPPLHCNPLGELIQLCRKTTVAEYQSQFLLLLSRCDDLVEKHQINIFTAGLDNPLHTDVELDYPATLDDAMALARIYEQQLTMSGDSTTRTYTTRSTTACTSPASKLLALPAPNFLLGATTVEPASMPRLKCLTVEEMVAKREHGECYKCFEKFTKDHFKVCPMKGIYLIELDEADYSAETDDVTSHISLHAITGISSVEAMKLRVCLGVASVDTLVDSGSTHSFISVATADCIHLLPIHRLSLQVMVANDDLVPSTGICKDVLFYIDKEEFVMDFFVIPLVGYEMVLVVQWLCTLSPILWDFANGCMSCWRDDHCAVWQGASARREVLAANTVTTGDIMAALLIEFDDVFSTPTELPPPRRHNHRIHLLPDTVPVAV